MTSGSSYATTPPNIYAMMSIGKHATTQAYPPPPPPPPSHPQEMDRFVSSYPPPPPPPEHFSTSSYSLPPLPENRYPLSYPPPPPPDVSWRTRPGVEPLTRCDSAPVARTTATYEPKEVREGFDWIVDLLYKDRRGMGRTKPAVALLDTQSQKGNWTTRELVKKINGTKDLRLDPNPEPVETPLGPMHSIGITSIPMRRWGGNKVFTPTFRVIPSRGPQNFEMIFGRDFINKNKILKVNRDALLPNLASDKATLAEQAAMAAAQEQRRLLREQLAANGSR